MRARICSKARRSRTNFACNDIGNDCTDGERFVAPASRQSIRLDDNRRPRTNQESSTSFDRTEIQGRSTHQGGRRTRGASKTQHRLDNRRDLQAPRVSRAFCTFSKQANVCFDLFVDCLSRPPQQEKCEYIDKISWDSAKKGIIQSFTAGPVG